MTHAVHALPSLHLAPRGTSVRLRCTPVDPTRGRGRALESRNAIFERVYQLGGLVVTLVNGLLGLILWRRLRAAFPRHGALIGGLCGAGSLLAALPALLMAVASFSGLRALQRHAPEPLSLLAMGAQVGLLLYGLLLGLAELAGAVVRALRQMRDDGAPRVLLSHHPGTFRTARELPFDLMLSGHTHGGQISLGRIDDYALTPMLAAGLYHNGHYEHRGRRLHVNAGAGGWLPVRINCPPEITLVELVPA